jgi:hypothetical protein
MADLARSPHEEDESAIAPITISTRSNISTPVCRFGTCSEPRPVAVRHTGLAVERADLFTGGARVGRGAITRNGLAMQATNSSLLGAVPVLVMGPYDACPKKRGLT